MLRPASLSFMHWDSYRGSPAGPPYTAEDPLTFNSRQERLHQLVAGDRLWLVSRCPADGQYYFVAALRIAKRTRNPAGSEKATLFGEYAAVADRSRSHDLGQRFPAEGLLRTFTFETGRPIRYGASIGQSLQTLRPLDAGDERVLDATLDAIERGEIAPHVRACGLWTKCDGVFADYFLKNWTHRREPLAFLLYDPPPAVRTGARGRGPVFGLTWSGGGCVRGSRCVGDRTSLRQLLRCLKSRAVHACRSRVTSCFWKDRKRRVPECSPPGLLPRRRVGQREPGRSRR